MNGNDIIITMDGAAIAGTKSDELQTGCETIPISSPSDGQWNHAIAGRKSWGLTVGFLLGNGNSFTDLLSVGTTYTLLIRSRSGSGSHLSGSAILTTCKITATRGNLVQGAFSFQGTGPLAIGTSGRPLSDE